MATRVKANNTTALNATGSWVGGVVPTSVDIAQWNSTVTGANAVFLGGALNVLGLSITNPGGAVTVGATAANFAIGSSGIDMSTATQNLTINSPVVVYVLDGTSQTWTVGTGRTLTISSALNGSGNITKSGAGNLNLTGTGNSNTGIFTQNGGTTTLAAQGSGTPNQLASVSSIAISSGYLNVFGSGSYTFNRTITGAGSGGGFTCGHPNLTLSGNLSGYSGPFGTFSTNTIGTTITATFTTSASFPRGTQNFYAGNSTAPATQTLKYTGTDADVSTSSNYTFTPDSNQSLTAVLWNASTNGKALTFSGAMTHIRNTNAVTLQLTTDAAAGLLTLSGIISQAATGVLSITKTGSGSTTLSGANTFTGNVTVSAGTLNANSTTALGAANSTANISVMSGATLSAGAALNYSSPGRLTSIIGTGVSNAGALVINHAGAVNVGAITLGDATLIRGTADGGSLTSNITGTHNLTLGVDSGKTVTFSGTINTSTGTLTIGETATSTGTVILSQASTRSGSNTLAFGTVRVGDAEALGSGSITFNGGGIDASTVLELTNPLTVSANITFGGTANLTFSSTVALNTSSTITTNGSGGALTFSGVISGGVGAIIKEGSNTLFLTNGANSYVGGTTVRAGILSFVNGGLGPPSGTIRVQNGTLQYAVGNTEDISLRLRFQDSDITTIDTQSNNVTFAGPFGANKFAKLIKAGTGTLKLTASNTYGGGTDINVGTVQAGHVNALSVAGTVTLSAGTVLQTLTAGGQNGKLTVASLNNAAGGIIRIGG